MNDVIVNERAIDQCKLLRLPSELLRLRLQRPIPFPLVTLSGSICLRLVTLLKRRTMMLDSSL